MCVCVCVCAVVCGSKSALQKFPVTWSFAESKPYVCQVIRVLDHLYTDPVLYSLTSALAQRCIDSPLH
jgi:hypothetical protein